MSNVRKQWEFLVSDWNTDLERNPYHDNMKELSFLTNQELFINWIEPTKCQVLVSMLRSIGV